MTRLAHPAGLVLLAAATHLPGQSTVTLPSHAASNEGHHSHNVPFGSDGFRTQLLIDAAAVTGNGALLQGLRFRVDRTTPPQPARALPNVTVQLSHSTVPVAGMSTVFATNTTETPIVVFQGTVQLPATVTTDAALPPWNVVVPFQQPFLFTAAQGNLLVEIVANNVSGSGPIFLLDANEPGGAATTFGVGGDHPSFDTVELRVATGPTLWPELLTIGRTIDFTTIRPFTAAPGVLVLGIAPLAPALDLGPLGAPGNTLYVDPTALVALAAWSPSLWGIETTTSLVVPLQPALIGMRVLGQSAVLDPTANALGLLFSAAADVRIGDPNEVLPVRQLDGGLPTSTSGFLVDFGGSLPRYGAVAVQLDGAIF